jgi:NAD(P)-dependent dehydrogenase (short-subunit alcohol dehydrogenase family)
MSDLLIITGGSAGIGLATVDCFLGHGYEVATVSRSVCPSKSAISIQADLAHDNFADVVADALQPCPVGGRA